MPSLHGQTILFFSADPPGAIWQDKLQIARRLATNNTLVICGPELHLRSLPAQLRAGHWLLPDLWQPALARLPNAGRLYRFAWAPWAAQTGAPGLGRLTASLRRLRWQAVLRRLEADRPILWLFRPGMLPLVDQFAARLVIYHVVDEYSAYPGLTAAQSARQRELDAQLTARADLVFCTARSLVEARQPRNPRTYYLPNAVDFEAFQRAINGPTRTPSFALQANRPRLGVVGGINAKLDLALLGDVARQRPDWTLLLIGPLGYGLNLDLFARLKALPNVVLPGALPPEQVPLAIAACDVCLIPYRLNEQTRHINPLKLYEYLAAGKPVVATPLPELAPYRPVISLAGDAATFVAAVEAALAQASDPAGQAERRAVAAANTWDQRVAAMSALIAAALSSAAPASPASDA